MHYFVLTQLEVATCFTIKHLFIYHIFLLTIYKQTCHTMTACILPGICKTLAQQVLINQNCDELRTLKSGCVPNIVGISHTYPYHPCMLHLAINWFRMRWACPNVNTHLSYAKSFLNPSLSHLQGWCRPRRGAPTLLFRILSPHVNFAII